MQNILLGRMNYKICNLNAWLGAGNFSRCFFRWNEYSQYIGLQTKAGRKFRSLFRSGSGMKDILSFKILSFMTPGTSWTILRKPTPVSEWLKLISGLRLVRSISLIRSYASLLATKFSFSIMIFNRLLSKVFFMKLGELLFIFLCYKNFP